MKKTNKIKKHIKDIYHHALKLTSPLRKMIHTGVDTPYNSRKMRAAFFIQYYIIED